MKTKVAVMALLVTGLCLSLALTSWAEPGRMGPHGSHRGHWGKCAKLTPEQAGKLFDLRQKFLDETAGLRKAMVVKRAELRALWRAENPDAKQILAKLKEINGVKAKLQEKSVPFRIAVKKLLPKDQGPKAKVSLEDNGMNPGPLMAREFGGPGEPGR